MPGSVSSVPPNPPILSYVVSVGGLVFSLMLTAFGFSSNAWIVLYRPNENDEFQRGIRGHDCYQEYEGAESKPIKCLPWDFPNKAAKFPTPFDQVLDVSWLVCIASYIVKMIVLSQIFYLAYTIGHCCSQKFSERMEKFKMTLFIINVTVVGEWFILFFIIAFETFANNILPLELAKPEYEYKIGSGSWLFFLGGVIPFIIATHCLFGDQMTFSKEFIRKRLMKRQAVPTCEHELSPHPCP